ncbi:hypothetical protein P3T16_002908 [Paraburkholderia sp. GAS42]|jgi:hypothetical protein
MALPFHDSVVFVITHSSVHRATHDVNAFEGRPMPAFSRSVTGYLYNERFCVTPRGFQSDCPAAPRNAQPHQALISRPLA